MEKSSILNRFELTSFSRMYRNASSVAKYSNRSIIYVLYDMAKSILHDNIGYMEYNLFHFIDKPDNLRKTYIGFNHSQALFRILNDKNYMNVFNNKLLFNEKFKDYIGRGYIDAAHCSDEDFKEFCKNKKQIFCKPKDSCSGKGIYKIIDIDNNTNIDELHKYMIDNDLFCEDVIIQNETMNKLNKSSINTIRITTVLKDDVAYPMYALLRIGLGDSSVDNVGSGGIYTLLDDNGEIVNPCWSDKTITTYTKHPTNGFDLIGFKVPFFSEAIELCKKAAHVEPHVRYVGWDVAITKDGPILVEGNELPGYDMPQNYFVSNKDTGLLPEFEKILGKIE